MYKKVKGRKYRVIIDNKPYIGIYVRSEYFSLTNRKTMPVFKVGRKFVRGYECYWLPLKDALEAERLVNEKSIK